MRLPRMTMRRWMIAVAVVGLLLGVGTYVARLARLKDYYARQSLTYQIRVWRHRAEDAAPVPPQVVERWRRLAERYEDAARRPWLPVEPDPPEPE